MHQRTMSFDLSDKQSFSGFSPGRRRLPGMSIPKLVIDSSPVTFYYHRNCSDGFGAAWSAWKSLSGRIQLHLVPVAYGDPLPPFPEGGTVYVADFSFSPEVVLDLKKRNRRVIVLDHHKTAYEKMAGKFAEDPDIYFDMTHSGAAISWFHFHADKPVPNLIRLIEDKDLWKWELPFSQEVNTALASYPFDLELWDRFDREMGNGPISENCELVREGKTILRYQSQILRAAVRDTASRGRFPGGMEGIFVNSPVLNSEIGGFLKPEFPMVVIWSHRSDGRISYSLRSSAEGPDVARIAEGFGGGGHARAAGFISDRIVHESLPGTVKS